MWKKNQKKWTDEKINRKKDMRDYVCKIAERNEIRQKKNVCVCVCVRVRERELKWEREVEER